MRLRRKRMSMGGITQRLRRLSKTTKRTKLETEKEPCIEDNIACRRFLCSPEGDHPVPTSDHNEVHIVLTGKLVTRNPQMGCHLTDFFNLRISPALGRFKVRLAIVSFWPKFKFLCSRFDSQYKHNTICILPCHAFCSIDLGITALY